MARDRSANGIVVHLEADIVVGNEVELLLTLPTRSGEATSIRGKVVRVERAPVGATGFGIAFAAAA
jgi:Tfp pilus assembly protein PilZ